MKKFTIMQTKIFLNALILLIGASIFAQVSKNWEDTNGDGFYDIDEFSTIYSKGYNDLDVDGDGMINDQEFYDNNYNKLDVNRDSRLTNEEWTAGKGDYDGFINDDDYSQNPPQYVSKSEFINRFKNTDYYSSYDTNKDGFIDSEEMIQTSFKRLDRNHDGKLDAEELKNYQ